MTQLQTPSHPLTPGNHRPPRRGHPWAPLARLHPHPGLPRDEGPVSPRLLMLWSGKGALSSSGRAKPSYFQVLGQPSARQLAARGRPDGGLRPHAAQVERHALRHPLSLGVQEAHRPTRGLRRARRESRGHCQPWAPPPPMPCGDRCAQPAPRGSPFGPLCPLLALSFSPAHPLTSHDLGGPRAPPGQGLAVPPRPPQLPAWA